MTPSVVGAAATSVGLRPISLSAWPGFGPRVTSVTLPSASMTSSLIAARSANATSRRSPSPVSKTTMSNLPATRSRSQALTGLASVTSRMLSMGQRRTVAPSLSRRLARSSSCRPSATAIVFPSSGDDDIDWPVTGAEWLKVFYGLGGVVSVGGEMVRTIK